MSFSLTSLILLLKEKKNSTRFKQVLLLYLVNFVGIPVGIITSIVITRFLGPKLYGDYKFLVSLFSLSMLIFTFGFFQAGNRALVLNNDAKKARELYGAELIIVLGLFLVMSVSLFIYARFDPNLKEKELTNFLFYLIPFCWIYLLWDYIEVLFQADNRINLLAASRFWPKMGFLATALLLLFVFNDFEGNKLSLIWLFYLFTQALVFIIILIRIKPSFQNLKIRIDELWKFNKSFGFLVYSGALFSVGFTYLTNIIISYFAFDNTGVGYYSLALTISSPLLLIPNVIATTHYKDFSSKPRVPKRLVNITLALSFFALISIWILVGPFIHIFYGQEFKPVIRLTLIISSGIALHGLADFFNRFLGSNGQGKALRNGSILVGLSLLTLSFSLIPRWQETGASISKALAGFIYLSVMLFYYFRFIKTPKMQKIK